MEILFLVRLRHSMDDIPLFCGSNYADALHVAREASWDAPQELLKSGVTCDCSTPCAIDIVRFEKGRPVSSEKIRDYEEEAHA